MKRNKDLLSEFSIIGITAFFLGCFFLLIIFGTGVYRDIARSQNANSEERSLSSYLLTVSKMGETAITIGKSDDGGKMLVIEDGDTGYGNRIYLHDGYLVEDYGQIGGKLFPKAAIRIAEDSIFEIEKIREDLLQVETDAGIVYIHIKNREAAQ
ncbi:MAG: DUF4860 domain-containing protein [Oscillospiraceae bacterium]|nr:DUF4860 domain-containing protein [Oscillospiraceae bacterium]MBQ6493304.1 DUF4860 domain-containing protein [Erysipelotrichaceae bacterium]